MKSVCKNSFLADAAFLHGYELDGVIAGRIVCRR